MRRSCVEIPSGIGVVLTSSTRECKPPRAWPLGSVLPVEKFAAEAACDGALVHGERVAAAHGGGVDPKSYVVNSTYWLPSSCDRVLLRLLTVGGTERNSAGPLLACLESGVQRTRIEAARARVRRY